MRENPVNLFHKMYHLLDELYNQNKEEQLLIYISDANTTVCNDNKSIDPVVYEDFEKLFLVFKDKNITDYEFIVLYLGQLNPYYGDIKKYFLKIPKEKAENELKM